MHARRWEFCLIGGLAVQRWGEMRTTLDVDITLLTGFGREEEFINRDPPEARYRLRFQPPCPAL
jgi:hypothetical protein